MTEWRAIPGYEGIYEITRDGQVRGLERMNARGCRVKGRVLHGSINFYGYRCVSLSKSGTKWLIAVHRLVMLTFVGPCPEGYEVLHADGTRTNNDLSNLSYGTRSDNVRDSLRHGTNVNAAKTHCKRGHEFTAANTYRNTARRRECRTCWNVRRHEKRAAA